MGYLFKMYSHRYMRSYIETIYGNARHRKINNSGAKTASRCFAHCPNNAGFKGLFGDYPGNILRICGR